MKTIGNLKLLRVLEISRESSLLLGTVAHTFDSIWEAEAGHVDFCKIVLGAYPFTL